MGSGASALLAGCATTPTADRQDCRASPSFADDQQLRAVAGLRPYRDSGFVVRAEPLGDKLLVHNYGHGGGGITLSWGSSTLAAALAPAGRTAAVIGAGVMGLTTARLLQQRGDPVTIYAAELPQETTSWVAGGQVKPTSIGRRLAPAAVRQLEAAMAISWASFQALDPLAYGIRWLDTYERADGYRSALERRYFPLLDERDGLARYRTMYVEVTRFLAQLLADFLGAGGRMEVRRFAGLDELATLDAANLFNCTGIGARALVGDTALVPVRGQLALLRRQPGVDYAYALPGGYMFPRDDALVLGGTYERGRWDRTPDPATIGRILAGHRQIAMERCFT